MQITCFSRATAILLSLLFAAGVFGARPDRLTQNPESWQPDSIQTAMLAAANWQLQHPVEDVGLRWWHMAPFYNGLLALAESTGDASYLAEVIARGEQTGWAPGDRIYHADDHAVGHAWLALYAMEPERAERLQHIQARMDYVMQHPILKTLRFGVDGYPGVTDRWSWCDALYMAPPTLVRLYNLTEEASYLEFMHREYRWTNDELWDNEAGLFYRDARFPGQRTEAGKKIFWSRGNGWVYGGLPMVLDGIPEDNPMHSFYKQIYLQMSEAILASQQEDGLWRPNLADAEQVRTRETSGSGFFLYGIAWGLRQGILAAERFEPVLKKGWAGLMDCIQPEGFIGYVQPVGFDPRDNISPSSSHVYGTGAFLLAGSEILHWIGANSTKAADALYEEAKALHQLKPWMPAAGGYVVPRRVDDLAWENDKIAFRVYGPSLRNATEDSGIDAWCKRVSDPVVFRWYQGSFDGSINYHEDTGEGLDAYKVGGNRGLGGTGLWVNGRLYTSNVYHRGTVLYTLPDRVKLRLDYRYEIEGEVVHEVKTITLGMGQWLCEAVSEFRGSAKVLDKAEFVVGLTPQSDKVTQLKDPGAIVLWESLAGEAFGSAVVIESGTAGQTRLREAEGSPDVLLCLPMGEKRSFRYRFGFTWGPQAAASDAASWMRFVTQSK